MAMVVGLISADEDGYPLTEDSYGCGGRALPVVTGVLGGLGTVFTISGVIGARSRVADAPEWDSPLRRRHRRIHGPLITLASMLVGGLFSGAFLHDNFCNT